MLALATTTGFLLIHLAVARWARQPFTRNLKLSRGVAAAVLVATGALSLYRWWPWWSAGFLAPQPHLAEAWPVGVLAGHLAADLLWLAGGRLLLASRTARDLVLHHLLGLGACAVAVAFRAGYALVGVVLLSEGLPVLTGVGAWARMRGLPALERWVLRASLGFLVAFRIPLWLFLAATFAATLAAPSPPVVHRAVAPVAFPFLALIVVLDLYWCRSYVRLLRDFPRRGIPQVSVDPLAPLVGEGGE